MAASHAQIRTYTLCYPASLAEISSYHVAGFPERCETNKRLSELELITNYNGTFCPFMKLHVTGKRSYHKF